MLQGWNSTWDRYVTDEFILKDTEDNRKLQKELAEEAQLTPLVLSHQRHIHLVNHVFRH